MVLGAWIALVVAWLVMYVLLAVACVLIYRDARRRGAGAELWLMGTLVPGVIGLLLMSIPLFAPVGLAWVCAPLGVLLTVFGPLVYISAWGRERGSA